MTDREKVIKGLECCMKWTGEPNTATCHCSDCSYTNMDILGERCLIDLINDAMFLLKEQEAKQGKWERQYSRPGVFANLFWWCSVCGQPTRYNDAGIFYQYCPRCGAKLEPCKET